VKIDAQAKLKCLVITVLENVSVIPEPPKMTELQVVVELVPKILLDPPIIEELLLLII